MESTELKAALRRQGLLLPALGLFALGGIAPASATSYEPRSDAQLAYQEKVKAQYLAQYPACADTGASDCPAWVGEVLKAHAKMSKTIRDSKDLLGNDPAKAFAYQRARFKQQAASARRAWMACLRAKATEPARNCDGELAVYTRVVSDAFAHADAEARFNHERATSDCAPGTLGAPAPTSAAFSELGAAWSPWVECSNKRATQADLNCDPQASELAGNATRLWNQKMKEADQIQASAAGTCRKNVVTAVPGTPPPATPEAPASAAPTNTSVNQAY